MDGRASAKKSALIYPWNPACTLRLLRNVPPWFRAEISPIAMMAQFGGGKELLSFRQNKKLMDFFPTVCLVWITWIWAPHFRTWLHFRTWFWSPLAPVSFGRDCQNKYARNTVCQAMSVMRFCVIAGNWSIALGKLHLVLEAVSGVSYCQITFFILW